MIREKFLKFLYWFKDHFLFLLEVVVRLSVGLREENNETNQIVDKTKEENVNENQHKE